MSVQVEQLSDIINLLMGIAEKLGVDDKYFPMDRWDKND